MAANKTPSNPTEKVGFPLKLKIILLISGLLLLGIGVYGHYAISLFRTDKTAYIYEASLSGIDQFSERFIATEKIINGHLDNLKQLSLLPIKSERHQLMHRYLNENEHILGYIHYSLKNTSDSFFQLSNDQLSQFNLSMHEAQNILNNMAINLSSRTGDEKYLLINGADQNFPNISHHVVLALPHQENLQIMIYDLSSLMSLFKNQSFEFLIRDQEDNIIRTGQYSEYQQDDILNTLNKIDPNITAAFVHEDNIAGTPFLIGVNRPQNSHIKTYTLISTPHAFMALNFLINQSFYFALLILSIVIIIGILFSKSLTKQLEKLYNATLKIASGDFSTRVQLTGRDEISALGKSFNFMAQEISRYIDEMKEKQRLQQELEVAKLVQNTFFPKNTLQVKDLEIAHYHLPASECGGDWWFYKRYKCESLILIADATGHGVPAALITSAVNSCFSTINIFLEKFPDTKEFLLSPAQILEIMNKNICALNGKIMLTAFCAIIDHQTGEMTYSNASHLDPYLLRIPPQQQADKSHIIPLVEAKGPRLGHKNDAQYSNFKTQLIDQDQLFMWTDGITERENPEGKQWGQRKFIKEILKNAHLSCDKINETLISEAENFSEGLGNNDDITLVNMRFKKEASYEKSL